MNKARKLAAGAAATVAAAGLSGAVIAAHASAGPPAVSTSSVTGEVTAPDTDTLRQGDQNTPDIASARTAVTQQKRAVIHAAPAAPPQAGSQRASKPAGESFTEAPEGTSESESSVNDGPGGHQDPAGDVQHEGGAGEQ